MEPFEELLQEIDRLQNQCTRCGICSEACPTFQISGWEFDSPRGKIHLAEELIHGRIDPRRVGLSVFDSCIGCNACESMCPLNVPVSLVSSHARQAISQFCNRSEGRLKGLIKSFFRDVRKFFFRS